MAKRIKTRMCQRCGKRFVPDDARRRVATCPHCGALTGKAQTKAQLRKRADWLFSRLIRWTAADERGYCKCVTCGVRKHWSKIDCGHFMSRRFNGTRWHWNNCWPQCKPCNGGFGANHWKPNESVKQRYTAHLRGLREDLPEELHKKAMEGEAPKMAELRELVIHFEELCREYGIET